MSTAFSRDRTRLRIGLRTGLILIMKMERLLEAAKVKLEEAKSRRACRGAASLCSKALAMDEKEQFPERAEFDAVIRKAEQKGRESQLTLSVVVHSATTRSLETTTFCGHISTSF
eukprot:COSAG04_NODE_977_length_9041_cov_4.994520_6_plen_115_part_00